MHHSIEKRECIISAYLSGQSLVQISEEQSIAYSTVKRIVKNYDPDQENSLKLNYANCGPKRPKYYRIYRLSCWLKRKHPKWGAPYILTLLQIRYPYEVFPSARTLQKWFRQEKLNKIYSIREVQQSPPLVKQVHDCWQIDAKEKIKLLDGTKACYLTTVDVKSGGVLAAPVFPLC